MHASTSASAMSRSLLCRCARPAVSAPPASLASALRRNVHSRPNLPYDSSDGLSPFLSKQALQGTAATWHQGCLDRLNDLARGTQYENKSVAQTVVDAAKRREDTLIFNYASEALNNGFFLSCLTPTPDPSLTASKPGGQIELALSNSFGSPTSFVNRFSSFANGIFGTGYVWLVMDAVDNLAVVATYGAGTVLVQGEEVRAPEVAQFVDVAEGESAADSAVSLSEQQQATDQSDSKSSSRNAASSSIFGQARPFSSTSTVSAPIGAFPPQSRQSTARRADLQNDWLGSSDFGSNPDATSAPRRANVKRFQSIHPLLCLSLHPHVYIPDYGIWGKEEYIKKFWQNVDWARVDERYQKVREAYNVGKQQGRSYQANTSRFSFPTSKSDAGPTVDDLFRGTGL